MVKVMSLDKVMPILHWRFDEARLLVPASLLLKHVRYCAESHLRECVCVRERE